MTYFNEDQQKEREQTRYQLQELFKSLVNYFTQAKNLPMQGWLSLHFGETDTIFGLTVFSDWHRERNRRFNFHTLTPFHEQKQLAHNVIEAIEADDFEKIIDLSGRDYRTGVQKYIDRQGPYTCHQCGKKQHDPFNRIEIMSETSFTILCSCDACNNATLSDLFDTDMMAADV